MQKTWIPAFAGMTTFEVAFTFAGMTTFEVAFTFAGMTTFEVVFTFAGMTGFEVVFTHCVWEQEKGSRLDIFVNCSKTRVVRASAGISP